MRTDVKIGIVVGAVLCVAVVMWIVWSDDKNTQAPAQPNTPQQANRQEPDPNASAAGSTETGTGDVHIIDPLVVVDPPENSLPEVVRPGESSVGEPENEVVVVVPEHRGPGAESVAIVPYLPEEEKTAELPVVAPVIVEPVHVAPVIVESPVNEELVDAGSEIIPVPVSGGREDPVGPRGQAPLAAGQAYVVKEGDSLWVIAEKAYGNGKHFAHIHKANPSIRPSQLRPGQKLTIPPLPKAAAVPTDATAPAGRHGTVAVGPTGEKVYVVKRGDMLWKIAENPDVYGKGEYWHLIQKANPGVNPRNLRPGRRLKIPPLEGDRAGTRSVRRAAVVGKAPTATEPGTYVVAAGDAGGFSDIAKKAYGSAALWPAIQKANPDVDTRRLRAGQELILPSLNQARRIAGVGSRPSRSTKRREGPTRVDRTPPPAPEAPSSSGTAFD